MRSRCHLRGPPSGWGATETMARGIYIQEVTSPSEKERGTRGYEPLEIEADMVWGAWHHEGVAVVSPRAEFGTLKTVMARFWPWFGQILVLANFPEIQILALAMKHRFWSLISFSGNCISNLIRYFSRSAWRVAVIREVCDLI